jgi:2,3-diketo-5-methylthio-1-phosphopentane phosphatase
VFPDVPGALERWHQLGFDVRVYSSGSELAQRLLFGSTKEGDLTRFLQGYFDTTLGAKTDRASYSSIADAFKLPAEQIVYISDNTKELDAARAGGMSTLLCMRPGNKPQVVHGHRAISSFTEIVD